MAAARLMDNLRPGTNWNKLYAHKIVNDKFPNTGGGGGGGGT